MFLVYLTEIFLLSYSEKGNTVPSYDFFGEFCLARNSMRIRRKVTLDF